MLTWPGAACHASVTRSDTESGDEEVKKKTGRFGIRKTLIS